MEEGPNQNLGYRTAEYSREIALEISALLDSGKYEGAFIPDEDRPRFYELRNKETGAVVLIVEFKREFDRKDFLKVN